MYSLAELQSVSIPSYDCEEAQCESVRSITDDSTRVYSLKVSEEPIQPFHTGGFLG